MRKITLSFFFLVLMISCQPVGQSEDRNQIPSVTPPEAKDPNKIYNLIGEELPPLVISDAAKETYQAKLNIAINNLNENPDSLDLIIWHGRRLAYLGKYLEAINVFSDGLRIYPDSYHLYRHRGHRYITTRQLNKAIKDFELAAYYSLNKPNKIEPDGLPNKLNQPLSNDKFNIWYHFGLANFLSGRYDKALSAYKKCMEFSDNNDLLVATTYWQYLTYMKLGNKELASELIKSLPLKMKLIENDAYYDLLLLFKNQEEPNRIEKKATDAANQLDPTLGYGLASFYQQTGKLDKANELFLRILESPKWNSFGYIAAEAELKTIFPVP